MNKATEQKFIGYERDNLTIQKMADAYVRMGNGEDIFDTEKQEYLDYCPRCGEPIEHNGCAGRCGNCGYKGCGG